jgi:hypothetical protein
MKGQGAEAVRLPGGVSGQPYRHDAGIIDEDLTGSMGAEDLVGKPRARISIRAGGGDPTA